jgi:AraC-like DNA-binding protein
MRSEQQAELAAIVGRHAPIDGTFDTMIAGARCIRISIPHLNLPDLYQPSLCVIVQGRKQVLLEGEVYRYAPSEFLAVSVDLPLVGQVLEASQERPYLCLQIAIDLQQLRELLAQIPAGAERSNGSERGLFVGTLDDQMLDALLRLARLLDAPQDIPVLAPMAVREIYYRVLRSEDGHVFAQIATAGSHIQKVALVIEQLRSDITRPISVEALAEAVSMSESSLFQHFKAVTAVSPLQYLKRLRLTTARQMMLLEAASASSAAYRVGYESPSQFSREYTRMFGAPPMRDIEKMRQGSEATENTHPGRSVRPSK